jgi:hypothetical protein
MDRISKLGKASYAMAAIAVLFPVQAAAWQTSGAVAPLTIPPERDGFLLHRGVGEAATAVVAEAGGVGLQEKSYELREWMPEFVLIERGGKTYLIKDSETVRHIWDLWDTSMDCATSVEKAMPPLEKLQHALAVCKTGAGQGDAAETSAWQKARESLDPIAAAMADDGERIELVWRAWDESRACRADNGWVAGMLVVSNLQAALNECRISAAEISTARGMIERLDPPRRWTRNATSVVTESRIWSGLDQAIASGAAQHIAK